MTTTETPKPRILFLAHILPFPLDGGAKIKSYHTLKRLAEVYEVTLVSFIRSEDERRYLPNLRDLCVGGIETVLIRRSKMKNYFDAARFWLVKTPFKVGRDRVGAMMRAVRDRMGARRFDAVHIDHLEMAQYVLPRRSPVKLILDNHNVESQLVERLAQTSASRAEKMYANREWPKLRVYELNVCRQMDRVLVVSNEDAATLRRLAPDLKNITVVPIGVDGDYYEPIPRFENPKTLLSIGTMYWPPNVDGVLWFYNTVYPLVKPEESDVRLKIVGADPAEKILRMREEDKSIAVTGYVADERLEAADCAAFIVPLRAGGGMRVKILNAMAMALPIVSTTVGAEGIPATHNKNIIIADNSEAFAQACVKLLKNPEWGTELGVAGRRFVEELYSWQAVGSALLTIYDFVLKQPAKMPEKGRKR